MINQITKKFRSDEKGTALVEVALVLPLVLLLSAGVFEVSNILNTRLLLEAGVEDAARYMARCSDTWDNCKVLAQKLAANGAIDGTTARVTGWVATDVHIDKASTLAVDTTTNTQLYLSNKSTVDVVTASTDYSYIDLGLWPYLGFGALTLSVSHQERVFGW